VHLPAPAIAPWIDQFVDEFALFPRAKHDDQVDCAVQALLRLAKVGSVDWDQLTENFAKCNRALWRPSLWRNI
jgi:phage terminase large subunit-like protein